MSLANTLTETDSELVASYLAGDREALAVMYDRYAPALYDIAAAMLRSPHDAADVTHDVFVLAAERLGQLREPSRLRPWLLAILRNEVYRRSRRRSRTRPTDLHGESADMVLSSIPDDHGDQTEYLELAALVREAAAGLDARDQLVLELAVRQGLKGVDLAAALGVSTQQSYNLVHRMRQRTERALGAFCVARQGRRDCPDLDAILAGWDGEFSVLIRKRVARHIDRCSVCEGNRRKFVPLALLSAAPLAVAPVGLRERVLDAAGAGSFCRTHERGSYEFDAPGGFPALPGRLGRRMVGALRLVAAVAAVAGAAVYLLGDRGVPSGADLPAFAGASARAALTDGLPPSGDAAAASAPATSGPDLDEAPTQTSSPAAATTTTAVASTSSTTSSTTSSSSLPALAPPGTEPPAPPVVVVAPPATEPPPPVPTPEPDVATTTTLVFAEPVVTTSVPADAIAVDLTGSGGDAPESDEDEPTPTSTTSTTSTTTTTTVVETPPPPDPPTPTTAPVDTVPPVVQIVSGPGLTCRGFTIVISVSGAGTGAPAPTGVLHESGAANHPIAFGHLGDGRWQGAVTFSPPRPLPTPGWAWEIVAADAAGNTAGLSGSATMAC